jgi:hypothetical protein
MPFLELNHLDEAICPLCDFEYVVTDNWPNDFSCRNCDYYSDVENHDKNAPFLPGEFECIECGRRASRFSANMFTIGRDPEEETCMDCAERQARDDSGNTVVNRGALAHLYTVHLGALIYVAP